MGHEDTSRPDDRHSLVERKGKDPSRTSRFTLSLTVEFLVVADDQASVCKNVAVAQRVPPVNQVTACLRTILQGTPAFTPYRPTPVLNVYPLMSLQPHDVSTVKVPNAGLNASHAGGYTALVQIQNPGASSPALPPTHAPLPRGLELFLQHRLPLH